MAPLRYTVKMLCIGPLTLRRDGVIFALHCRLDALAKGGGIIATCLQTARPEVLQKYFMELARNEGGVMKELMERFKKNAPGFNSGHSLGIQGEVNSLQRAL